MFLIDRGCSFYWIQTGMVSLTVFANCSLGQRQLLLGNDKTGKTTLSSNILKNSTLSYYYNLSLIGVFFCFYMFIGSSKREYVFIKRLHNRLNKFFNFFVDSTVTSSIYYQITSPFDLALDCLTLCYNGVSSLTVFDNLSNHAKVYRTFMLSLKRAPGREAYPGDIFYLHSSLLESFGCFNLANNSGSLTAIPLATTQQDDLTDYISTNLISITDGQ